MGTGNSGVGVGNTGLGNQGNDSPVGTDGGGTGGGGTGGGSSTGGGSTAILILLPALALSACGALGGGSANALPEARCRAAGAEALLGKQADDHVVSEAIVSAGAMRSRLIRPGSSVTLDRDPLRLNIEVDESGKIRRMQCG